MALNKLSSHLWYLFDEIVALAFVDQEIPDNMKRQMVVALSKDGDEESSKCVQRGNCAKMCLTDFVSMSTWLFFQKLKLDKKFLHDDPCTGKDQIGYQSARRLVQSVAVTNDSVE